jgi:hypothetical protein
LRLFILIQSIPAKPSNKYKVKQKEEKEGKDAWRTMEIKKRFVGTRTRKESIKHMATKVPIEIIIFLVILAFILCLIFSLISRFVYCYFRIVFTISFFRRFPRFLAYGMKHV